MVKVIDDNGNTMADLVGLISNWGESRGITAANGTSALHQMSKMMEEFAEWQGHYADAILFLQEQKVEFGDLCGYSTDCRIAKADDCEYPDEIERKLRAALTDDFGDMLVCMIQAMRLLGIDMTDALSVAYTEIAPRRGLMIRGKFVKYDNLPDDLKAKVDAEQPASEQPPLSSQLGGTAF